MKYLIATILLILVILIPTSLVGMYLATVTVYLIKGKQYHSKTSVIEMFKGYYYFYGDFNNKLKEEEEQKRKDKLFKFDNKLDLM